jgi:hypothetical protein
MRRLSATRTRFVPAAKRIMNRYLEAMAYADPAGLGWHPAYWPEPRSQASAGRADQASSRPITRADTVRPRTHHAA